MSFASDVLDGLSSSPKFLSSKYFYDDEGSRLFRRIMELPEYYLTRAERSIFETRAAAIFDAFSDGGDVGFDLVELGAGDGSKTAVLVEHFNIRGADFRYAPVDISAEALDALAATFAERFPSLRIEPHAGDYFDILGSLRNASARRKVVMFLGSNIGNFSRDDAVAFFRRLRAAMNPGDLLFTGFDLQKDPRVILAAYDDAEGVTSEFNLNLLRRINRELGGRFDLAKFSHYAVYRPTECAARSFLISRAEQEVAIDALGRSFRFDAWEPIFMEISQKYSRGMIAELAQASGFEVAAEFADDNDYFVDSLWRPAP